MIKKFHRFAAVLLCLIMLLQVLPLNIIAVELNAGSGDSEIVSVDSEKVPDDPEPAPDTSADEVEEPVSVEGIDFSTKRLLVGTGDSSIFPEEAVILKEFGNVYLLEFEDEEETAEAYIYYSENADFVDSDIVLTVADDDYVGDEALSEPVKTLTAEVEDVVRAHYDVAIIDTGVPNDTVASASVIGGEGVDDNGHGTAMLDAIKGVSDTASVLSVKAFDGNGEGYLSDVYAAMLYAIEQNVDVISLSFAAECKTSGDALRHAVEMADEAGITVVGAAGNDGADVSAYLPGCVEKIYIVGACDEDGVKLSTSNGGENVLCNVVAGSTSEAAAKLAAIIAVYGNNYVNSQVNNGVIFDKNYSGSEIISDEFYVEELTPDTSPVEETSADVIDSSEEHSDIAPAEETSQEEESDTVKTADKHESMAAANLPDKAVAVQNDNTPAPTADTPSPITNSDPNVDWTTPPEQDPVTVDTVTIETIYVRWLSRSDGKNTPALFGDLNLAPEADEVTNQQFQIDISLSGQQSYAPGDIEIRIPAYLWLDRDGNEPGEITLAVPKAPMEGAEFVWERRGDEIVITNGKTMSAASMIMIQGTFRGVVAHEMRDETVSDPFSATVTVKTPQGHTAESTSNEIFATIDTEVEVTYASKTPYNSTTRSYDYWWNGVPSIIPQELLGPLNGANPDDYVYVRWYITGTASGNQPFDMYVDDTIAVGADGNPLFDGIMLGVSHAEVDGTVVSPDGRSVHAQLFHGYNTDPRTAYVWTAYPKDSFPAEEIVSIPNTQTISVTGIDDHIESTKSARASVDTKVPTIYTFIKNWDDNDDLKGHRPDSLHLRIYYNGDTWRDVYLTRNDATDLEGNTNDWTYTWSDDGLPGDFDVREFLWNASGTLDEKFDGDGHRLQWNYFLKSSRYDPVTHTWYYVNAYEEGWYKFELSRITKYVEYKFDDEKLTSNRDGQSLNKLLRNEAVLVQYDVWSSISAARALVWYNASPNKFILEDSEYYLNDNHTLTTEDIDIGLVNLASPVLWRYVGPPDDEGYYKRERIPDSIPPATLYGFMNEYDAEGNEVWVPLATLENGSVRSEYTGVSATGMSVSLPKGVARVKLEIVSDAAAVVELRYTIGLRIYPTNAVKAIIEEGFEDSDYLRLPLYNKAHASAIYIGDSVIDADEDDIDSYTPGDHLVDLEDGDTGYLHGRQFRVATDLTKNFKVTDNDLNLRRIKIYSTLNLTQQSNVIDRTDYEEAIRNDEIPNTNSGVYYDLLPNGVDPDLDSVTVGGRDTILRKYIIENYQGTGRTMLVVEVSLVDNISYQTKKSKKYPGVSTYPDEGYRNSHTMSFYSYCSWDFINGSPNGLDMRNLSAYEANEADIGSMPQWMGEYNDPNGGANRTSSALGNADERDMMTNLPTNRENNDPSFVYAGSVLNTDEVNISALTELRKHVQVSGSGYWSNGENDDVNVQEGGLYTYRFHITSGTDNQTSDIILLDAIENYVPIEEDRDYGDRQWRGGLVSLDLSQATEIGIKPVVYYCTVPDLDISDYSDETIETQDDLLEKLLEDVDDDGNHIWTTDVPENMYDVTGIAIDMRKTVDDEEFILPAGQSISLFMNMRAPFDEVDHPDYFKDRDGNDTDGKDHMRNAHAYNNVYLSCVQIAPGGREVFKYIHYDYTKVGIYSREVFVKKVWSDDDDRDGIRSAELRALLYADGEYTGKYVDLSEENEWSGSFGRLPSYREDGTYINYTYLEEFDAIGGYTLEVKRETTEDGTIFVTLTNTHIPEKIEIPVTKLWDDDSNSHSTRPASIRVRLYADGEDTGKTITITPDVEGNWSGKFTDLYKYHDHGTEIVYTVVEDEVTDYIVNGEIEWVEDEDGNWSFVINNQYYPFGDLHVTKHLLNATTEAADTEFSFNLILETEDEDGNTVDVVDKYYYIIYDANGDPLLGNNPLQDPETEELYTGEIGNGNTFILKDGQTIVVYKIPAHVKYKVTENSLRGFELTGSVGTNGEISSWTPAEAEFTNTYTTNGVAQMKAQKSLTGRALEAYKFRFYLYDENGIEGGNILRTANNTADGLAVFGQIGYSNDDDNVTYTYYISEYDAAAPGYTYDDAYYKVEVTPHDNGDGTMDVDIVYFYLDDEGNWVAMDGEEDIPLFENEYHADGSIVLRAWKVLDVRELEDEEFTFDLYNSDFEKIGTATNIDGIVNFEALNYNETHVGNTYWYYVREQVGDEEEVVYDGTILGYEVTVADNGDGTLSFNQNSYDMTDAFIECEICGGSGIFNEDTCADCSGFGYILDEDWEAPEDSIVPVFYNGLKDGSLAVSKYIKGEGDDFDPTQEFHFKVKLIGEHVDEIESPIHYEIVAADDKPFPEVDGYQSDAATAVPVAADAEYPVTALANDAEGFTDITLYTGGAKLDVTSQVNGGVNPWTESDLTGKYVLKSGAQASELPTADLFNNANSYGMPDETLQFDGWYASATYSGTAVTVPESGGTYYAKWNRTATTKTSTASGAMKYTFTSSAFNISAPYKTSYNNNGYKSVYVRDSSSPATASSKPNVTIATSGNAFTQVSGTNLYIMVAAHFVGAYTSVDYYLWNRGDTDITDFNIASGTDTQIDSDDGPSIIHMSDEYGDYLCMKDDSKSVQLHLYGFGGDGTLYTPLSAAWAGTHSSSYSSHYFDNTPTDLNNPSDTDNSFSFQGITIPANGVVVKNVLFGDSKTRPVDDILVNFAGGTGEVYGEMSPLEIPYDGEGNLPASDFVRYGYKVTKWVDSKNNKEFQVDGDGLALIPANTYLRGSIVTLTAHWEKVGYAIRFEPGADDFSGSMSMTDGSYLDETILPRNKFIRMGQVFTGWKDEVNNHTFELDDDGYVKIPAGTYPESVDSITLIAMWAPANTNAELSDGEFEFTLRGGEKAIFPDLPAGTAYQVWEETPDGWVLVEQVGASGIIEPLQQAEAEFYNLYQPDVTAVNIIGTKMLDNQAADSYDGSAFTFQLWERLADGTEQLIETVDAQAGGFILFDTIVYKERDIGTHTYIIREVNGGHPDIHYDDHEEQVTVEVYEDDGNLYSTLTYDTDGSIRFVNHILPGSLEISKVGENMYEGTTNNPDFYFKVTFYNEKGTPIEGESFYWYVIDSETGNVIGSGTIDGDGEVGTNPVAFMSAEKEKLNLENTNTAGEYGTMATADHGSSVHSGTSGASGNSVSWEIFSDGTLVFKPTNAISGTFDNFSIDGNDGGAGGQPNSSKVNTPWYNYAATIKSVEIHPGVKLNTNSLGLFFGLTKLTSFTGLENLDTSGAENLSHMFYKCESLTSLDVSSFDTSNVKNMTRLFGYMAKLNTLTLGDRFDTRNVTTMRSMFYSDSALNALDVSTFDTRKVEDMFCMFYGCSKLTRLDLTGFNTARVTNANSMLTNLSAVREITLGADFYASSQIPEFPVPNTTSKMWIQVDPATMQLYTSASLRTAFQNGMATPGTYVWDVDGNIIYFNQGEGDVTGHMSPISADFTQDIRIPENTFVRPGYELSGWMDADGESYPLIDGVATIYANKYPNKSTVILTAQWEKVGYVIRFNSGASDTVGSMTYEVAANNEDFVLPRNKFIRMGYVFAGWLDDKGNEVFTPDPETGYVTIPGGTYDDDIDSVILTAKWTELDDSNTIPYYIYHYWQNISNEDSYTLADMDVKYAVPGTFAPLDVRTYPGFITPEQYPDAEITLDEVLRVSYYYNRSHFTVNFNGNGAELGSMNDIEMISGIARILGNGFTKNASAFLGWNTEPDGHGIMYSAVAPVELVAEDGDTVTLYAQWLTLDQSFEPTQGELTVWCKAGQTIVFPNLPAGTTYTIEEINLPYGWTKVDEDKVSGTIYPNVTADATVVNRYSTQGTASITAHKSFVGGELTAGMFTFELYDADPTVNPDLDSISVKVNGPVETVESDQWYGWASVVFDGLTFDEPGEYVYYILERGNSADNSIAYDSHMEIVTVVMRDNGDGTMSAEIVYNTNNGAPFTNSVAKGGLTVHKVVEHAIEAVEDTEFGFYLELKDANGEPLDGTFNVVYSTNEARRLTVAGGIGGPIYIKGDEYFTITDLPHGTVYTVTEANAPGFTMVDFTNAEGVIEGFNTIDATCTNEYTLSVVIELEATKNFIGGELQDGMFTFELMNDYNEVLQTVTATADGCVVFDPMVFTREDLGYHLYRIREVAEGPDGVKYDRHTALVQINVYIDSNGDIQWAYEDTDLDDLLFLNATVYDLTVSKTVSGNGNQYMDFDFILSLANEYGFDLSEVTWTKGDKNGTLADLLLIEDYADNADSGVTRYAFTLKHDETITFSNLPYGTTYTVQEVLDEDLADYYDTTVTVSDDEAVIDSDSRTVTGAIDDADVSVAYDNYSDNPPIKIAGSGGIGIMPIYLLSIALMLASAIWLFIRRRRYNLG